MMYHVELYIFADIQLLIFIIAFKNKAVKIKIWLLQRYAAAAFCVMMLLRVIFSFVRTCALRRKLKRNFCEIALSFKPPAKKDFGILKIKYLFSVIFNFQCRRL